MPRLIVESGPDAGMVYQLIDDAITIGRSASCTVQVADKRVSRHHTVLRATRGSYVAEDLGSKNGTELNSQPLVGRVMLKSGDRVTVGDTVLVFERDPLTDHERAGDTTKTSRVKIVPDEMAPSREERRLESTSSDAFPGLLERAALSDPFQRLKVLYQVADSIRSVLDLDQLLQQIMDIIWNVVSPYRGVILLLDEVEGMLEPVVVRTREPGGEEEIAISRGVVERCMSEKVAILVSDAPSDVRFAANDSILVSRIRSVICAPLVFKDEVLGVLYLDSLDSERVTYTNDDLELITGIANQAATAISNARLHRQAVQRQALERELEIARTIQTNLLPREFPTVPGASFAALSRPAQKVGGDFYDAIPLEDGRVALVMADVSGKGVAAAILTATIRASVRMETHMAGTQPVSSIVSAVNRWTCRDATNNMFATMFYCVLDPKLREIQYTNAGHVYPLVFRKSGQIIPLETGGCFLGIMEQVQYEVGHFRLQAGDTLVFYTDGVSDSHNVRQEMFGQERLIAVIAKNLHLTPGELCDEIYEATLEFRGEAEQFDDISILVARF